MTNALELVRELVAIPGPPGQEEAVRQAVAAHADALGCVHVTDERGNLLIAPPGVSAIPERPDIVVMAHLDEIAMLVVRVEENGLLTVTNMGGAFPWKWGEGPVSILAPKEHLTGILSFGSIHTASGESPAARAKENALTWDMARIFTGLTKPLLVAKGVRPGTRVCLHPSRRILTEFSEYVSAPFLDDRADIAALLLALEQMTPTPSPSPVGTGEGDNKDRRQTPLSSPVPLSLSAGGGARGGGVLFAATAAEEVGGHGALYLCRQYQPTVGIALEVGPRVPESPFPIDSQPTVWVNDSYSAMQARDIDLVAQAGRDVGMAPHWQALSRGGSDASCAASHGLIARPITLAFAAENSHGHEIMHRDAVKNLATLLGSVLERLSHGTAV